MSTITLTPDELRQLEAQLPTDGPIYLTVEGEDCDTCTRAPLARHWDAPSRFVEATGPCPTCGGAGRVMSGQDYEVDCPSCEGTGIKRAALATRCPKHMGRLAFTKHGASGVFDRCPNCTDSSGSVLFAHANVEMLPVDGEWNQAHVRVDEHDDKSWLRIQRIDGQGRRAVEHVAWTGALPVPGRDWIVVLDGVVLA